MSVEFRERPVAPPALTRVTRRHGDRSRLRSAAALLLVPVVVLALLFVGAGWNVEPFANRPYALALAAQSNGTIVVLGPFAAVAAAWEMAVLRAAWGKLIVRRSRTAVLAGRLGLVVGCGAFAMLAVYAAMGGATLLTAFPGWSFPVLSLASIVTWTLFGAALALVFRQLIALPLAVLVPFLLLGLPQGWSPLWLRHVNGYLFDCCGTSEVLDHRAVVASLGFLTIVAVGSLTVMAVRLARGRRQLRRSVAGGSLAFLAALVVGLAAIAPVRHLGALPTTTRPASQLDCLGDVCLWPKDVPARAANTRAWRSVRRAWTALGLPLRVNRVGPIPAHGVLGITTAAADATEATVSMANALPRALVGCTDDYDNQDRNDVLSQLSYLVLRRTGAPNNGVIQLPPDKPAPRASDAATLWASVRRCP